MPKELPYCDLVMKGGITSGIAYPPVLYELSQKYRFKSIGGTSAGAIAAAAAAAAEYARYHKTEVSGFDKLMDMSGWLGRDKNLLHLFDAPKGTRAIITLMKFIGAVGGTTKSLWPLPLKILGAIPRATPIHFGMGAILGVLFGIALARLLAPGLAALISIANSDLQWLTPGALATGVVALLSALITWLAREALQRVAKAVIGALLGAAILGVILTLVLPWALSRFMPNLQDPMFSLVVLFSLVMGYLVGVLVSIYHLIFGVLLKAVPRNYYGIVNGHDSKKDEQKNDFGRPRNPTNATDWLSVQLDEIAGLSKSDSPLTFGDLSDAGITLKMISTNVSVGLPFELPFTKNIFIFNEFEMRKLFPDYVVDHMLRSSRLVERSCADEPFVSRERLPQGYYYVPQAKDFPVVVAIRMSLAVPIFISAIPIYSVSMAAYERVSKGGEDLKAYQGKEKDKHFKNDLLLNYFSDGGTASNFPIHFFDSWLPTQPTFGINLTAMPADAIDEEDDTVETSFISALMADPQENMSDNQRLNNNAPPRRVPSIELPRPGTVLNPEYRPISNPLDFILKTIDTARENHDNQQAILPGYSERIIQVRFKEGEGGMNLAMSPETIDAIMMKGQLAGTELRYAFNFEHHRWTRFRVLMSHLETELEKMHASFNCESLDPTYARLIAPNLEDTVCDEKGKPVAAAGVPGQPAGDDDYPHQQDDCWRKEALTLARELLDVVDSWKHRAAPELPDQQPQAGGSASMADGSKDDDDECVLAEPRLKHFSEKCPEPKSALRITPQI